jgi:translation initiation factor 2B subunit (eIF-2B alpha/beta/delta family)
LSAVDRRRTLVENAASVLSTVRSPLIYDYSSTVADLIKALAASSGLERIVIPESRAIDGGRRYMTALSDLAVPMLFLPDSAIEYATSLSDVVLLGAETVTLDGGIMNTIGSITSARAAKARDIPVYGAADLFKVGSRRARDLPAPALRSYDFLLKDGERAATEAPELELVPPELITAILTETGRVAPADLAAALVHRKT